MPIETYLQHNTSRISRLFQKTYVRKLHDYAVAWRISHVHDNFY